ncbi:MAG: hypothetical protein JST80_02510 [Bdellovibrionales bacterium]|nr:hypothetical protein [Bdellovibrionales bacterium]
MPFKIFLRILIAIVSFVSGTQPAQANLSEELQVQIFRYATDNSPTFYLSSKTYFLTDNFLTRIDGYFESGSKGAWSIDPDPLRYTFKVDETGKSFVWIGRDHPLNFTRSVPVEPTSALGTVWAQNQLEALNPRVSGWIGAGLMQELDPKSWKLIVAYSPIFIPTFGPSLGFTERGGLNPARFARLPPQTVTTGGVTIPIRYRLEIGQLKDLLLQHQAMIAINHDDEDVNMDAYLYTAPHPDPVPTTNSALGVSATDVNAKVDINVQFPREYWGGMRTQFKKVKFSPAFEVLQRMDDLSEHYVSFTGYFNSLQLDPHLSTRTTNRASFGLLTHFQKTFDTPKFSDGMVFLRLPVALSEVVELRTLVQATLLSLRQSFYWINEIEWSIAQNMSLLGAMRLLAGEDNSYFGDWRDQDSYSAGLRWIF